MKPTISLGFLFILSALSLPGKEIVVKMAVKRGQTIVDPKILPLVCITIVLDHAALPISHLALIEQSTKDRWVAEVGSINPSRPHVLTAMQGDHRSLTMLIMHLKSGRYELQDIEFEGKGLSLIYAYLGKEQRFYIDVKPECVNYVGSLVLGTNWWLLAAGGRNQSGSVVVESTALRDLKWSTDVVPGMAGLPAATSDIESVLPNQISGVKGQVKK